MKSLIDILSNESKENHNANLSFINEFNQVINRVNEVPSSKKDKIQAQGKLLPMERLENLVDDKNSFLPIAPLAGYHMDGDRDGLGAGGGIIAGIGFISGIRSMILINNYTLKGGTISPAGVDKILRVQEIAMVNKLPIVHLLESGGANLNYASEVFIKGGKTFANQARLSAMGIPQIVVVHGNATAGGAYQPGLSDYIILIKNQSKMFLGGPPLVKAATGEVADEDSLGGDKIHSKMTGTGEFLVENDLEAILKVRDLMKNFKNVFDINVVKKNYDDCPYDPQEILSIIPKNKKKSYDIKEILIRILDDKTIETFKEDLDKHTVCCYGDIEGTRVGFIGNNGPINSNGANKATQFIQLCHQLKIPLVFLHNTTGFMVGTHSEKSGLIKHGSKMIQAVTNANIPKISIVIGGSYGAGNYAMCGRGISPDFIFAWPNSNTAVMGGDQAGKVMRIVTEEQLTRKGQPIDEAEMNKLEKSISKDLSEKSTALYGSAHLWDDGIIDPRDTRKILASLLDIIKERDEKKLSPCSFGVARV